MYFCASSQLTLWSGVVSSATAMRGSGPQPPPSSHAFQSATVIGSTLSANGLTVTRGAGATAGSLLPPPMRKLPLGIDSIGGQVGRSRKLPSVAGRGGDCGRGGCSTATRSGGGAGGSAGGDGTTGGAAGSTGP